MGALVVPQVSRHASLVPGILCFAGVSMSLQLYKYSRVEVESDLTSDINDY